MCVARRGEAIIPGDRTACRRMLRTVRRTTAMPRRVGPDQFARLFLADTPWLDVRAESEFQRGSFPGAVNIPILNDAERHQVGLCYKQRGQAEAIALGHRLVNEEVKAARIAAWRAFVAARQNAHVFCWRGGMRSGITSQWLAESGIDVPVVEGGYKALRRFLLQVLEQAPAPDGLVVLGGRTGVGKTDLLRQLDTGIDLEGYAGHRGSSFGRRVQGPSSQAGFENALAVALLRALHRYPGKPLVVEDEGRRIGHVTVPEPLFDAMACAPLVVLDMPLEVRCQRVLAEYVVEQRAQFEAIHGTDGLERYRSYLLESLYRIRNRLGLQRYAEALERMTDALDLELRSGDVAGHLRWVELLLREYYDPMYDYQLRKVTDRVAFAGNFTEVLDWLRQRPALAAAS